MSIADSLYEAFSKAETGGVKDPWIRTYGVPGSSSTAYGPVQITATLARDYLDRFPELFDEKEIEYLNKFLDQGKKFIKYGREKGKEGYDSRYDYGGSGDLISEADKALYERVAKKMLMKHYDNNQGDLSSTIKEWRFGAASPKGKKDDERYWREVENTFVSTPEPPPSEAPETAPLGFLDNLELWLKEARQEAPETSQPPSEINTEDESPVDTPEEAEVAPQAQLISRLKNAFQSRRDRNEKRLKRTANEAKLEATAVEGGYPSLTERLRSSGKAREVLKTKIYDRPTNVQRPKEEPVRREDASKDPTYGIF